MTPRCVSPPSRGDRRSCQTGGAYMQSRLLAKFKTPQNIKISLRIDPTKVVQQTATSAHHTQQTTPAGIVLLVRPQMLSQLTDSAGQKRNLDLGRTGIVVASLEALDQLLFTLFRNRHLAPHSTGFRLLTCASHGPSKHRNRLSRPFAQGVSTPQPHCRGADSLTWVSGTLSYNRTIINKQVTKRQASQ